ncbi:MAG TPA: DUF4199 domain-containing protein [Bacteroidales bacterium]|nr:DUF4199 domain-containing protein [Bacteroidales bacterium]
MEQKVNPWKDNLTNGLILGLIGIVYTLIVYFLGMTQNKIQGVIFLAIQLVMLYILIKSYRDNFRHGQITYGQAVGAGVIIVLYYSIIMAVFIYILYGIIDPGLVDKQLAAVEQTLSQRGMPQASIDAAMKMQAKFMKPAFMAPMSIITSVIYGTILSLIAAIFVRKEGNPLLLDTEETSTEE